MKSKVLRYRVIRTLPYDVYCHTRDTYGNGDDLVCECSSAAYARLVRTALNAQLRQRRSK
jgi:hypothetical protein